MSAASPPVASRTINIALGKPAAQSSRSVWTTPLGAGGAVNGDVRQNFGIHTDIEDAPWWSVDLLESLPLDVIVVHNRRDACQERARSLRVEVSVDGRTWTTIHSGVVYFGALDGGIPLILPLGRRVWARHVRLSLAERTFLHLCQVEVFSDAAVAGLVALRRRYDIDCRFYGERPDINEHVAYTLTSAEGDFSLPWIGLELSENGAFGNCAIQYLDAWIIAKRLNLPYIKVAQRDRSELIRLTAPVDVDGVTVVPAAHQLPAGGVFLWGSFFDLGPFRRAVGNVSAQEAHRALRLVVGKVFNVLPPTFTAKPEDELMVHIRSGDIFRNWINPHYVQPPLSFYIGIIRFMLRSGRISRVKLVFENRLNPVIDRLEDYLRGNGIAFATQSGRIDEDVQALVNGRYMVFGVGTFGPTICHLSESVEAVFFFSPETPDLFAAIPTVRSAFATVDAAGEYIKPGEWQNTPEQREMMVNYPADKLHFTWPDW